MIDQYGRTIEYLRVSVTDRCNLRCVYALVCIYRYDNDLQRQAVHAGNDNRRTV